jgi:hypothetical protein
MIGRCLRRLALLAVLAGAGALLLSRVRGGGPAATPSPSWPPFEPTGPAAPTTAAAAPVAPSTEPSQVRAAQPFTAAADPAATASAARWVAPIDGQCPDGYPIKANDNSGIFHVPGGRFYARTVPERCYAAAEDAVADGYRQAKA